MADPRYTFVVPIYKDGALAEAFCVELERVMRAHLRVDDISQDVELIFVNDGSPDDGKSSGHLDEVARRHGFVRVIELSRNFGQHIALSAGFHHARGRYVGMLNVDMEDPPDQIPLLLAELESKDVDMVYGLRGERAQPWHVRLTSILFNWVMVKLTGYETPLNVATLRIMDRPFLDAYNALSEKSRYIPGLEMWMGFKKSYVQIRSQARVQGTSSYTFRKRLKMAFEAVISFSDLPLRMLVVVGTLIALTGFVLSGALIAGRLFFVDFQAGYTSTVSVVVFLGGVQILVVGLASLYIGRILREVQNRPLYLVRRTVGFEPADASVSVEARAVAGAHDDAQ